MAIIRESGIIFLGAVADVITEAVDVRAMVISNSNAATQDVVVKNAEATPTALFTITVPLNGSVTIPFGGLRGKHFPDGIELDAGTDCTITLFLA